MIPFCKKYCFPLALILFGSYGNSANAESTDSTLWGQAQGMSAAVLIAHTTEPLLWVMGDLEGGNEHLKPLTGILGYGIVSTGLFFEQRWSLWAAIAMPTLFWTPHLVFLGTNAVGWTDRPQRFNGYNIPMIAMEGFVMARSIQLLKRNPRTGKASQIGMYSSGSGIYLAARF